MSRHRSSLAAVPLEDQDLLKEILLRLPPKPSSFPRGSLVCKRWRCILSDPLFLHRFRKHHRKPTLIGFFDKELCHAPVFTPMLYQPDRVPFTNCPLPEKLLGLKPWVNSFFGCRHGIALFLDRKLREAVLWDPLTGVHRCVAFPPGFGDGKDTFIWSAAVLCAASDNQHVHGDCHMNPFKLVFTYHDPTRTKASVCIYESMPGVWGDIISTPNMSVISRYRPSVFVGNALCWLLSGCDILTFDFERLSLAVIEKPANVPATGSGYVDWSFQILRDEDNCLGLAVLSRSKRSIQLWARKSKCDAGVSWVLQKTVQFDELFSRPA